MALEKSQKRSVIIAAQKAYLQGQIAEFKLRLENAHDEATVVWRSTFRLGGEIDILLGRAMEEWSAKAEKTIVDLRSATDEITAATASIRRATADMTKAVKIAGHLDDVVLLVKKVVMG